MTSEGVAGEAGAASKHTPGPWKFEDSEGFSTKNAYEARGNAAITHKQSAIAVTSAYLKSKDEEYANARLIAAAPELLQALRHQIYRNHDYSETCDACRQSIAALRKAEGL